jgi:hypothetical protein
MVGRRQDGNKVGLSRVWQRERRTFTVVFVFDAEAAFHLLQGIHGGEGLVDGVAPPDELLVRWWAISNI